MSVKKTVDKAMKTRKLNSLIFYFLVFIFSIVQNARGLSIHPKTQRSYHQTKLWSQLNHDIHEWGNQVLDYVDDIHIQSSTRSTFAIESKFAMKCDTTYEWIHGYISPSDFTDIRNVALRTISEAPLLDEVTVKCIREAASKRWDLQQNQESRFTLQSENTNSECHLDELVSEQSNPVLKNVIDEMLQTKIYPLVREAFAQELRNGNEICVYDSLVIRYNGDNVEGLPASQPLHRDGSIISVNIALNDFERNELTGENGFEGGGTFFEGLICNPENYTPILRPIGTGHAVVHCSNERHAGAPTTRGVREILVFFLTQRPKLSGSKYIAPPVERAFHLKRYAKDLPKDAALATLDIAVSECQIDGEAHFFKGFRLLQRNNDNVENNAGRLEELNESIKHLQLAKQYAPYDARINCYVGIAHVQRLTHLRKTKSQHNLDERSELEIALRSFMDAIYLSDTYDHWGISSDFDLITAILPTAETLAQLERYTDALEMLERLGSNVGKEEKGVEAPLIAHANALSDYCRKQISSSNVIS